MYDLTKFLDEANKSLRSIEKAPSVEEARQGIARLAAKLIPPGRGWASFLLSKERVYLETVERWFPDGSHKSLQNDKREWKIGEEGLVGYAAAKKTCLRIGDVTSEGIIPGTDEPIAKWYRNVDASTRSELVLPCITGDRLMGVLNLECCEKGAFGPEHESMGKLIASQVARLVLQKLREQFIEAISRAKNREELTSTIVDTLPGVVGARACAIFLLEKKSNQLIYHASTVPLYAGSIKDQSGMRKAQKGEAYYKVKGLGFTRWVFDHGIPLRTTVGYSDLENITNQTEEILNQVREYLADKREYLGDKYEYEGPRQVNGDDRVHWLFRSNKDGQELIIPEAIWSDSLHDTTTAGCRELMLAPIQGLEREPRLGVVRVSIREGTTLPFTPEDLNLLLLAAKQMGVLIESLEKTQDALEEEQEIHDILSIDTGDWREEFRERVNSILAEIQVALGCEMVLVWILDDSEKHLVTVVEYPPNLPEELGVIKRKPIGMGACGLAMEKRERVFISDASQHECMLKLREAHKRYLEDLQQRLEECRANQCGQGDEEQRILKLIERAQREERYLEKIGSEWAVPLAGGKNQEKIVGVITAVSFQPSSFKLRRSNAANGPNWQAEKTGVQPEDQFVLEYYHRRLAEALAIAKVSAKRQRQLEAISTAAASMQGHSEEEDIYRDALIAATHEEGLGFHQAFVLSQDEQEGNGTWRIDYAWGAASPREQGKAWGAVCQLKETLKTSTWANCGTLKNRCVSQTFNMRNNPTAPCLVRKSPRDQRIERDVTAHEDNVKIVSADDIGALRFMETLGYDVIAMAPFRVGANSPIHYLLGTRQFFVDLSESICRHIEKSDVQMLGLLGDQIGAALEHLISIRGEKEQLFRKAVEEVAADTAHKIGSALGAIDLRLGSASKRSNFQQVIDDLGVLEKLVAHARRLVEEVKNLSGEINLRIEEVSLPDLIDSTFKEILTLPHSFHINAEGSERSCLCDREGMADAFRELARNATVMKPWGVNVVVEVRQDLTNGVEILFRDDGPGVPTELKERIFERFFSHRPGQTKGTGLGLSFVRKIIETHRGQITEIGNPGEGACFRILLSSEMFRKKGGE